MLNSICSAHNEYIVFAGCTYDRVLPRYKICNLNGSPLLSCSLEIEQLNRVDRQHPFPAKDVDLLTQYCASVILSCFIHRNNIAESPRWNIICYHSVWESLTFDTTTTDVHNFIQVASEAVITALVVGSRNFLLDWRSLLRGLRHSPVYINGQVWGFTECV